MITPEEILQKYWGYNSFRPLQKEIIMSVLEGNDTLALLPTGGGKSLCYQVPAIMCEGFCLVISPLIALMQDQVKRLKQLDVAAECLYSGMNYKQVKSVLEGARDGAYKLLYVSPERLQTNLFKDFLYYMDISLIAVDEAHCVSQWGHDFRPDYLRIAGLRELFTQTPILALTATATRDIEGDLAMQLKLRRHNTFRQSFARNNIFFSVQYSENKRKDVKETLGNACSIVYCRSRKNTELLGADLNADGVPAVVYHAGVSKDKRELAQEMWMNDEAAVMVATTAFGMGIDKPDVRMVLHYDAPEHIEAWYQEAGRAGRDGQKSLAITFFNNVDITRLEESTALQYPSEAVLRKVYQSVAEYLQIAVGTEPHQYYSFDVNDFCTKFNLNLMQTIYALKLLEREGLWTLTESVYSPSTVQFITDRSVLDNLQISHPNLAYISVGLLRIYNAIFFYPTHIREANVARQLKVKQAELINALEIMHRMEILEYNRAGEGPQLFFHHTRADSQHLLINLNRIAILRKRHEARTEAMLGFLNNDKQCRERYVLQYFGELADHDCGHCDICRTKKKWKHDHAEILNTILQKVKSGNQTLADITGSYLGVQKVEVIAVLRKMIDEGIILVDNKGVFSVVG